MAKRHPIEAPPLVPPRYGLLAAMAAIDVAGDRWENGVEWAPEQCGTTSTGLVQMDCVPGTGELGGAGSNRPVVGFDAFEVWAADECTSLAPGRDFGGRARRLLEATRSHQIAKELWGGALTTARHAEDGEDDEGPSPFLTDGDGTVVSGAVGMLGLARVDAEFARCSAGRRAALHLTPWALAVAMDGGSGYVYRDGNLLLTQLGSIVVTDTGYGDSVTDLKVYATGLVGIRLGTLEAGPPAGAMGAELHPYLNRDDNTIIARAQQPALYQFDDCCRVTGAVTTS